MLALLVILSITSFAAASISNGKLTRRSSDGDAVPSDAVTNCDPGWYAFGEKCFLAVGEKTSEYLPWIQASESCRKRGAVLASIHSDEENDFLVYQVLLNLRSNAWIGLHDQHNESIYEWDDGSVPEFQSWGLLEPTGLLNQDEDCVEMMLSLDPVKLGRWNDLRCHVARAYVCQKPKDAFQSNPNPKYCSEEGGYRLQNSCYHTVLLNKTWTEAEEFCSEKYKGHLIAINDGYEQRFLDIVLEQLNFSRPFWIGIKVESGKPLKWSSGWPLTYSKLDKDPRNGCVYRFMKIMWIVVHCEQKWPFVCEFNSDKAPAPVSSTDDTKCPGPYANWVNMDGNFCYYVSPRPTDCWYKASFLCNQRGGHLASIHSFKELGIVQQLVGNRSTSYYIGLFQQKEDNFTWSDGTEMDFQFWADGEPSNIREQCTEMVASSMKWNDILCELKRPYICSIKKVSRNQLSSNDGACASSGLSGAAIIGVVICVFVVVALLVAFIYICKPWKTEPGRLRKISQDILQTPKRSKVREIVVTEDSDCCERENFKRDDGRKESDSYDKNSDNVF